MPILMLVLGTLVPDAPASSPAVTVEREAWVMGTRFGITADTEHATAGHDLAEMALLEVERVDRLLSTWDPATPLSRINRAVPNQWIDVEPELMALLLEAERWAEHTRRAFDASVGSLVDVWDLRGAGRQPSPAEVSEGLIRAGSVAIQLEDGRLRRRSDAAWIDSGGFGKGAALRSVSTILRARMAIGDRVVADLGGQLLVLAAREEPLVVRVAHPSDRSRPAATLFVHTGSVATSGTSERGRHILDPRTGHPAEAWGSVTVVHDDPLAADVLATALFVMGPDEGLSWALREGVAALFLEVRGQEVAARWTPGLSPSLVDSAGSIERLNP